MTLKMNSLIDKRKPSNYMECSLFKSKVKRDNTCQSLFNLVIKMLLDNVKRKFPQVLASFGGNLVCFLLLGFIT